MKHSDEEIMTGYMLHATGDESYFWAFVEMLEILEEDVARAWRMTCEMITRTSDEAQLEAIAAGPLEDILEYHGEDYITLAEEQARRHENFRMALSSVFIDEVNNPEISSRVKKAAEA